MGACALPRDDARRVGRYELIERLDHGGQEAYLARVSGLEGFERLVVVERAPAGGVASVAIARSRMAAALQHRNISQVYDLVRTQHGVFIVREHLHGVSLRALLDRVARNGARLPLGCALAILSGVSAAVHYVHERSGPGGACAGLRGLDLSASNLVVTYSGCAKLVSVSRWNEAERDSGSPSRQTDLRSLGRLAYEVITGAPLPSDDAAAPRGTEPPSARAAMLAAGASPALERVVSRALERRRARPFSSARELLLAIESVAEARGLFHAELGLAPYMAMLFGEPERAGTDSSLATSPSRAGAPGGEREAEPSQTERARITRCGRLRGRLRACAFAAALVAMVAAARGELLDTPVLVGPDAALASPEPSARDTAARATGQPDAGPMADAAPLPADAAPVVSDIEMSPDAGPAASEPDHAPSDPGARPSRSRWGVSRSPARRRGAARGKRVRPRPEAPAWDVDSPMLPPIER